MSKITIDRELLKQRVDALRNKYSDVIYKQSSDLAGDFELDLCKMQRALETSSKDVSAMAQPQREPVDALDNPRPVGEITWGGCVSWNGSIPEYGTDLYTSPPARRPLTDWVSVDERLPEKGGYYLVTVDTDDGPHVDVLLFNGKHWEHEGEPTFCHSYLFSPTHWANRPEAAHGIKEK